MPPLCIKRLMKMKSTDVFRTTRYCGLSETMKIGAVVLKLWHLLDFISEKLVADFVATIEAPLRAINLINIYRGP